MGAMYMAQGETIRWKCHQMLPVLLLQGGLQSLLPLSLISLLNCHKRVFDALIKISVLRKVLFNLSHLNMRYKRSRDPLDGDLL